MGEEPSELAHQMEPSFLVYRMASPKWFRRLVVSGTEAAFIFFELQNCGYTLAKIMYIADFIMLHTDGTNLHKIIMYSSS